MTTVQIITDAHSSSADIIHNPLGTKLNKLAIPALKDILVQGSLGGSLDAVLDLGDLIEHSTAGDLDRRKAADLESLRDYLSAFKELKVPHFHLTGNHTLDNLDENEVLELLGRKQAYFSEVIGGHRVIFLHPHYTKKGQIAAGESSGILCGDAQLEWLEKELSKSELPVLICCHHPLAEQDFSDHIWFKENPQQALPEDYRRLQEIIGKSKKVVAVINGHIHWNYLTVDDYGTPHITLQSLSKNIKLDGRPACTYGILNLEKEYFELHIFGRDTKLKNMTPDGASIEVKFLQSKSSKNGAFVRISRRKTDPR